VGARLRGLSENPEIVALYAGPLIEGLQGKVNTKSFLAPDHVICLGQALLGDRRDARRGATRADTQVSEVELRDVHGAGYVPCTGGRYADGDGFISRAGMAARCTETKACSPRC
jgi:beta-glucosidase